MKRNAYLIILIMSCMFNLNCETCDIKHGSYGGGMLFLGKSNNKISGEININQGEPAVKCHLTFIVDCDNSNSKKEIELKDPFGNLYPAIIKMGKDEIYIQAFEQLGACQRVLDLKRGESFSYDK
ncbi:hypothetical protein [Mesonia sp. K4-1]|uniref:hypothetical protein n=1 Tax=Mesonia sp. K4-1 TaxID=2602760 RepID=UPI0011C987C6|nr:hypothetical protein [Mesonia sp. K4-1]TXK75372.1 hypothetical protein FT986_10070 [Mesonia sp. K4-1]